MPADAAEIPMTPLVVARAELAAEDIRLFELRHPDGAELPEFTPGAHVSVETPGGARSANTRCATIPPSATATRSPSSARRPGAAARSACSIA